MNHQTDVAPRCGYVGILGKPNAGKSTLLNGFIGQKLAGVSAKAQTTRNKILGIDVVDGCQMIFLDTPGIHNSHQHIRMNKLMNDAAWSILADADYMLYLIDCRVGIKDDDIDFLKKVLTSANCPVEVILSKSDSIKKFLVRESSEKTTEVLKKLSLDPTLTKGKDFLVSTTPTLLSAKRPTELSTFKQELAPKLPEGPFLYGEDELTDKSQKFVVSELVREHTFRQLGDEIPYGVTVVTDKIDEKEKIVHVDATIIAEREAHKPIIIGKNGSRIKKIGMDSRTSLEQHFEKKVMLDLFVKVESGWIQNEKLIEQLQGITEQD